MRLFIIKSVWLDTFSEKNVVTVFSFKPHCDSKINFGSQHCHTEKSQFLTFIRDVKR